MLRIAPKRHLVAEVLGVVGGAGGAAEHAQQTEVVEVTELPSAQHLSSTRPNHTLAGNAHAVAHWQPEAQITRHLI